MCALPQSWDIRRNPLLKSIELSVEPPCWRTALVFQEGKHPKTLAKIQVTASFLMQDMRRNFYPNVQSLYGDAVLVPIQMGTNIAVGNGQKHLSPSFATKAWIYFSRNSKTLQQYQYMNYSDSQILRNKSLFNQLYTSLGLHVNAA